MRQRSLPGEESSALLLHKVQRALSRQRKQGRRPKRRWDPDRRRGKSAAIQYFRRRTLPGARGVRVGRPVVGTGIRWTRQPGCPSCSCLVRPPPAFAPRCHPGARRLGQLTPAYPPAIATERAGLRPSRCPLRDVRTLPHSATPVVAVPLATSTYGLYVS